MPNTRFAPSPTGYLHLGHAYSAFFASDESEKGLGTFQLRIEDIDPLRCKTEFTEGIFEDLAWLGLNWPKPVRKQSEHLDDYQSAFRKLREEGFLYPCFCTRKQVMEEVAEAVGAPHTKINIAAADEVKIYPGTCRDLPKDTRQELLRTMTPNWRLNVTLATGHTGPLFWDDAVCGRQEAHPGRFGDVVLARKDVPTSYHLSVTVDDHLQGIDLVTRGRDLFRATDIHRLLQELLNFEVPAYHHHDLLLDHAGKRFAKRDKSLTLRALRDSGHSPADLMAMCSSLSRSKNLTIS